MADPVICLGFWAAGPDWDLPLSRTRAGALRGPLELWRTDSIRASSREANGWIVKQLSG